MPPTSRRPRRVRALLAALATLLGATALAVLPSSPAMAIQTIAWTTAPPATATLGDTVSFAWSGTANTFLGARITGCFANFPDAPNYTNNFGGNFTTGNCNYTNRVVTTSPTYPITVGFNLSTGGTMTMSWNIGVTVPAPTLVNVPSQLNLTATEPGGAVVPPWTVYAYDGVYGSYSATCSPAAGSVVSAPGTYGGCSATNAGGKSTSVAVPIYVAKGTPAIAWSPPAQVVAGRALGTALNATVSPADVQGTISYSVAGNPLTSTSSLPAGNGTVLQATFVPSGSSATNWNSSATSRIVDVVRIPQVVTFGTVPTDATVEDVLDVTATGTTGGGAVTISAAAGSTCTVADHSTGSSGAATVTVTSGGACVLEARQAQTETYLAAPVVQKSITAAKKTPVISWSPATTITYGDSLADLLGATTTVPGAWTYRLNGNVVAGAVKPDAGTGQVLSASFAPDDPSRYTSATASRTLTVQQAAQHLDVAGPGDRTYGDAPFDVDVSSDGSGDISVTATGPCSVVDRTVTALAGGDCEVTVSQAGDGNHLAADDVVRTVTIAQGTPTFTWNTPEDITYGDPIGDEQLDATVGADVDPSAQAPVGETTYTLDGGDPAEGAVLGAGDHVLHARWEPVGSSVGSWQPVEHVVVLHVAKAVPTLTWSAPAAIGYGVPLGDDQLTAAVSTSAQGDLTYALGDGSPARHAVLGAGHHTLRATFVPSGQDAGNYETASVDTDLDVFKAAQAIDFTGPGSHTYGDAPFDLTATGGESGQPVTFRLADGTACTLDGTTVTVTSAGTCSVTASQDGSADFEAAIPVTHSVTVAHAVPTLAWSAPQAIVYGTALGAAQLDASVTPAGATGTVSYVLADGQTPADGALLHAGTAQTVTALFEPDEASSARFDPTSTSVTIDVTQAPQAIDFEALADHTYGDAPVPLHASGGGSGEPVTFATAGVACHLDETSLQLVHAGDCTVTAGQAGTGDYQPATSVDRSFLVARGTQGLALGQVADRTYGAQAVVLDLAAPGSGPAAFVTASGPCTVAGTAVQLAGAGRCTVVASRPASPDWLAASVTRAFTIAPAALTVSAPSAGRRYGAASPVLAPSYSGFVNGEGVADLATPAACASPATATSPAGSYPVTCTGAGSPDYVVSTQPGTLRVRYGLSGLARSLAGADARLGTVPSNTAIPVRIRLRGAAGHLLPKALSASIGTHCLATIRIDGAPPVCFRYRAGEKRFGARLHTQGLAHGAHVDVVVEIRAADGTVAQRRTVAVDVR